MLNHASRVSSHLLSPSSSTRGNARLLLAAILAVAGFTAIPASAARADVPSTCDKVASPLGSDSAAGTAAAPLHTAQALSQALAPGQVGCLRAGSYGGGLRLNHGGTAGAPLILRSYPGEQAQVTGRIYVPRGSDYVTIADLSLDGNYQSGAPLPGVSIAANHTTFESRRHHQRPHRNLLRHRQRAVRDRRLHGHRQQPHPRLRRAAIDQRGSRDLHPGRDEHRITGDLIDHNADRGIQFYPSAQGSVVTNNVIANNGEGIDFGGDNGVASNSNTVEHNLIVNSDIRGDVESWYPPGNPIGVANTVQSNCVSSRGINTHSGGFVARANVTASSSELVASEGGYVPAPGSACASIAPGLPHGIVIEGTRSGGAPTPPGKEAGAGSTPAPVTGSPTGSGHGGPPSGTPAHGTGATRGTHGRAERRAHRRRAHHRRSHSRHPRPGTRSHRGRG